MPPTMALPLVGITRVVSIPAVVVLPAPLGPSRPKISPRCTDRSSESTAFNPPGNTLVSCSVWMTSSAAIPPSKPLPVGSAVEDAFEHGSGPAGDPSVLVPQLTRGVVQAAGQ